MIAAYSSSVLAAIWLGCGLVFGLAYFALLRRTVGYFAAGGGAFLAAALTLGRLVGAVAFFGWAACVGALPVLAAFLGFVLARAFTLRAARRPA